MHDSTLQSLAAYLEHVATINGGGCLDCTDDSYDISNWETHL